MRRSLVCLLALVALAAGCSEPAPTASTNSDASSSSGGCGSSDLLACAKGSTIAALLPDKPTKATGAPITLGMINQENTPAGSFPELSKAVQAGVAWVNDQLGGVDGRPLKVDVCNTKFSTEGSTACAQQFVEAKVPAVLGGIDVFGNGVDTLRQNDIPYVGGIPVSDQSVKSPNSFQWSGGTWGATVAFAHYAATTLKAKKVAIIYGEFGSITESAQYGKKVLDANKVETQLVPYPITATDITSPLQAAAAGNPDAIVVLAADTGCKPAFTGVQSLGIKAQIFYVGACAAPPIINSVPPEATNGAIFNVENPLGTVSPNPDFDLYISVVKKYDTTLDPIGAGTVSFRSFMNLYAILRGLGKDNLTPRSITDALRKQVNTKSFMGHDYTCDEKQFEGLPAMCSPQQILAKMQDRTLAQLGTWIDVGQIYKG